MKSFCLGFLWLVALTAARAAPAPADVDVEFQLWKDPLFRKRFMGTYGIRSDIEPTATALEFEQMAQVADLMEKGSIDAVNRLISQNLSDSTGLLEFTLANVYFQQDDLEAAETWYRKAIEKFPNYQRAHQNLGMVRVRREDFADAVAPLTRAIELGAVDGLTYGLLGVAYLNTDQVISAENAYRLAMLLQPEIVDWKVGLAQCLLKQQKFGELAALCDELLARYPDRPDFWILQANAFLGLEQPLKAAENYEYVDLIGKSNLRSLTMLGNIYASERLTEMAADAYLRAVRLGGEDDPEPFVRNARILVSLGAYTEAERILGQIRETFEGRLDLEDQKDLLLMQAQIAAARGLAGDEQARLLQEVIDLDPNDGRAMIELGRYHADQGDVELAIIQFERAAELDDTAAEALAKHGELLVKEARYREALPKLKRSQELRPRENLAAYIEQVESLARTQR